MPFLSPRFHTFLPAAITTAVLGTLLAAPPAGAAPTPPGQGLTDEVVAGASRVDSVPTESTDRFIVKFEGGASAASNIKGNAFGRVAKDLGISVKEVRQTVSDAVVVEAAGEVPSQGADSAVALLNSLPGVEYAEKDVLMRPLAAVNDEYQGFQWNLFNDFSGLRVSAAWDRSTGAGQTIAILDTGITAHNDLLDNVLPGYDFVADPEIAVDDTGRDADPSDPGDACQDPELGEAGASSWHGTHVAGIAAAKGNNAIGIAGAAHGANLLPIRVMGACGGDLLDTVDALTWAAGGMVSGVPANASPARIINLSLGSEGVCSRTLQNAIDFAVQQGSVVIAAAGNEFQPAANVMPANCRNVVTVGATSRAGDSASYSNYGPEVDVSAPGGDGSTGSENILSTFNTGMTTPGTATYAYMQGTSMAAPHVAGVAALMLSINPALTPAQIEQMLRDSAQPFPGTCAGGCGTGIVDATAAVTLAAGVSSSPSLRSSADVVAADSGGTLWNYPSNGRGGFLPREKVGSGWSSLKQGFVTDWNSDGVLDIIAQWKDGRLTFYAGRYDGGFATARSIGTGWGDYFITVGKWRSSDRFPGIVATDPNGALWFYANASGGALSPRTGIGTGWRGLYLTMTDFDGDARMDILAKRADGNLIQYRSDGSGRFLAEARKTVGSGWQIADSMAPTTGFTGTGQQGLMTRLTDGSLAYYPYASGGWGARSIVGSGWGSFNLFR